MYPLEKFRDDIKSVIAEYKKIKKDEVVLAKPPQGIPADLAYPCFGLAKREKRDPVEFALTTVEKIKPRGLISRIEANGPYINFYADWSKMGSLVLNGIIKEKNAYGKGKKKNKILVEHTSANPDGPLHLGHFRNTVIGDSLARILRFYGHEVKTDFYVNDTGRQITLASWMYLQNEPKPKGKLDWWVYDLYFKCNQKLKTNPSIENEITDMMLKFENGDKELRKTHEFIVDQCLKGHKETLESIGIKIDRFSKESEFLFTGKVDDVLKKILKTKEGKSSGKRVWVDLKQFKIEREFTLTRSDGTTIYPARDLAYHADKFERADQNINIIGTDQKFYFKQLTSTLGLLFPKKTENYHVLFYEFLLLPEGTMSTRLGKFISVDELVKKFTETARKSIEIKNPKYSTKFKDDIAKMVGIGALKYAMIKVSPEKTYSFSVDDSLNFEGNTAPYIQYTHARASSILQKAGSSKHVIKYIGEEEKQVMNKLMEFPYAVKRASKEYRPHIIANYAYDLATSFNNFYHSVPVLKAEKDLIGTRLAIVKAAQIVLKTSLDLLGIEAPDKM
ncbi:MAG: arginine--tRNA ligase [Candidatus Aenigmatarchaeota archaeon]